MGRIKGSKNKKREEVLVLGMGTKGVTKLAGKLVDESIKEVILKEEPKAKQVGHPIAHPDFNPKPDMGRAAKEPENSGKCNGCPHEKKQHFNGTSWCSQHGCPCGQYK